ncbi:MAG: HAD-IA family hydrolase [Gammaproteobacteria bacterium]|nr:HAD-IA family hydrolase [Gammaproteobacteria bacterium]
MQTLTRPASVLFDLDGTLADTALDLGEALNNLLSSQGKATLAFSDIRPLVSKGAPGLLKLGFDLDPGDPFYEQLRERLLHIYQMNICRKTCLFDGLEKSLTILEQHSIPWGIVTNKPGFLTDYLLTKLKLPNRPSVVVSGDTFEQKKPHPMPLLEAVKKIGVDANKTWYVGDDRRDMEAAKAATMPAIAALWGYIPEDDDPKSWPADYYCKTSESFLKLIESVL